MCPRRAPAEVTTFGQVTAGRTPPPLPSRRAILRTGALGGAIASLAAGGCSAARTATAGTGLTRTYDFNQGWLFGGGYVDGSAGPGTTTAVSPRSRCRTRSPRCPGATGIRPSWEEVWIYRKHFGLPERRGARVLVQFDGVMVERDAYCSTAPAGRPPGRLPAVVDRADRPPGPRRQRPGGDRGLPLAAGAAQGAPGGPATVDYLQPGGIYRDVTLRVVPEVFLSDVFARPADVLGPGRRVEVQATIDAAAVPRRPGPGHRRAAGRITRAGRRQRPGDAHPPRVPPWPGWTITGHQGRDPLVAATHRSCTRSG